MKNNVALIKQNDDTQAYIKEFIANTEDDLQKITIDNQIYAGSTCIVAATGNVYILNASKEWVQL